MTFAEDVGFANTSRRLIGASLLGTWHFQDFYPGACALDPLTTLSHVP